MNQPDTILLNAAADGAVDQAAEILLSGGLVAFPTETVYGLGASAVNSAAIARVFVAKGRPPDNPLIVHVDSLDTMDTLGILDQRARRLVGAFSPGPLTLVVPARGVIPSNALAGLDSIALRIPSNQVALNLLQRAGALVAPSANLSGRPSPTEAGHVIDDLGGRIDAVLDGGVCRIGIESTVLDLTGHDPTILRPGRVTAEQIAEVIGKLPGSAAETAEPGAVSRSPGTMYRHYAPSKHLAIVDPSVIPLPPGPRRYYLVGDAGIAARITDATSVCELNEHNLYRDLRRADGDVCDEIVVVVRLDLIEDGLRDRLLRAAGHR